MKVRIPPTPCFITNSIVLILPGFPGPVCFANNRIVFSVFFIVICSGRYIVIRPVSLLLNKRIDISAFSKTIIHRPRHIQYQDNVKGLSGGGRGDLVAGIGLHIQPVTAILILTDPLIHGNLILRIGHRVFLGAAFGWRSQRRHRQQAHAQCKHAYPT